jgi:hypothetical protein
MDDNTVLGKRKLDSLSSSTSKVEQVAEIGPVEDSAEDLFWKSIENISNTELLFDSFRKEFRVCSYPPMLFLHQFLAFFRSLAQEQAATSSILTCVEAQKVSIPDAGDLDRDILQMRRRNRIKVIVPRIGRIHDTLLVDTSDYLDHIAPYLNDNAILEKFSDFLKKNNQMSFSKKILCEEALLLHEEIDALLTQGILRQDNFMSLTPNVNLDDAETSSLWLSSPIIGSILGTYQEAEVVVIRLLRKGTYKEMLEARLVNAYRSSLEKRVGSKLLPWRFVMLEMFYRGIINTVKSPRGTVIRLVK